jgi:hypothetical protein
MKESTTFASSSQLCAPTAKYLIVEGLKKYVGAIRERTANLFTLHPTQSKIQNYQTPLQNPGAVKSLTVFLLHCLVLLPFFFFDFFFCIVHFIKTR